MGPARVDAAESSCDARYGNRPAFTRFGAMRTSPIAHPFTVTIPNAATGIRSTGANVPDDPCTVNGIREPLRYGVLGVVNGDHNRPYDVPGADRQTSGRDLWNLTYQCAR